MEEPVRTTTWADVFLGAFGLVAALTITALLLGAIFGGLLIGYKRLRAKYGLERVPDSEALRITPTSSSS